MGTDVWTVELENGGEGQRDEGGSVGYSAVGPVDADPVLDDSRSLSRSHWPLRDMCCLL